MSKRDEFISKMKLQFDELDAKMDKLEAKAAVAKEDVRVKYKEEMTKLREQSKLAKGKLQVVKAAGEDKWDEMVKEMEKVRDAVVDSFNRFKSKL